MSAKPKPDAQANSDDPPKRQPMPFEPKKSVEKKRSVEKKPGEKKANQQPITASPVTPRSNTASPKRTPSTAQGIPDVVSRRMVQRVAFFSGIPTALGMSTFVLSYLAVSQGWFDLPTYAVLFVSLGWFGLGVLGVSYGVLSASWDEEAVGSRLGFAELSTNWARMTEAWRSQNQSQRNKKSSSKSAPNQSSEP
ncbi:MAG: DUF3464 family protein [Cyanobacteria bacterium RM1_2_2]|nr:DUF3464 family protein [Cyanobacteria bacterium RM1_2_2]